MAPISELITTHPRLVAKLRRFSFPAAAQLVGALGLLPELLENTIRVEILTHLVATCCQGNAEPKPKDLAEWIGKLMADSPAATMEDPAEDLFVACVNSNFGSFRVFQGNFGDGAFLVERLINFLAKKSDFPFFQDTIDRVLALLKLADTLAERAGLSRYCAGSGNATARIQLPRWNDLEPRVRSIFFSDEDLRILGIGKPLLSDFFLGEDHRAKLSGEVMWASSLERHPLLGVKDGLLVIEPSTLCRTAVRFMVEGIAIMGDGVETFYQIENATTFVNDIADRLRVERIDFTAPAAEQGTPHMFPYFAAFDLGKPVIMLSYTAPLEGVPNDFAGFDRLTVDEQSKFQRHVESCAAELEKDLHFSGGMVLVSFAGYGRGGGFGLRDWSPKWRVHVATLRDWLALTADRTCTAMRLWKLGEHEARCQSLGIKVMNPAGLPNLFCFWKKSGFRLVPLEMDLGQERKMIILDCAFAHSVRVEETQHQDEHCILGPDGKSWVRILRHNSRAFFPEDRDALLYGAIDEARRRLIGCTKRGRATWWIVSPDRPDRAELRDLMFQLWDCILNWANHLVIVVEREWPLIGHQDVKVRLVLPDFARWDHGRPDVPPLQTADLSVATDQRDSSITITIPEGFLRHFNVPKNVAEQRIVAAMIEGAARLAGDSPKPERIAQLTREVVRNDDARYFHVVETREIEQLLGAERRPRPLFVGDEDTRLADLGLADLVGRPRDGNVLVDQDVCRTFLQDIVTKIWERIEIRLRAFDRASLVTTCFHALDEISRDEAHWNLTTRSLLALHDDHADAKGVLRHRRSQRAAANLANRLLIETAQYACRESGGLRLTMADHSSLLAELTLLITYAHHRDAIAFGFLKPEITVHPNGEVEVDEEFYNEMFTKYLSHRSDHASARAAEGYDKHFEPREPSSQENSKLVADRIAKLNEVFEPEFGFSIEKLIKIMDVWRGFALKSKVSGGQLAEPEMMGLLQEGCDFSDAEAAAFLNRLTLPIRSAWDADLPPRCKKEDVYPWRFRRHLSLLVRPLVQVASSPRAWIVSAPFFKKSAAYITEHVDKADFPERFFASAKMREYVGHEANRRGHAFAERVRDLFVENGLEARLETEMSELGASKDLGLGDIDVLAWNGASGRVFAAECKRLLPALTVREVIQRLEDFRGDKKEKDSLGRHLRRLDWLSENPASLAKVSGIPKDRIQLTALLVTSDLVPMQFFTEMNFPPGQVVPFDDLAKYLAGL